MPQTKQSKGKPHDAACPITSEARRMIEEAVMVERATLPVQLRFTDEEQTVINLRPREPRFVDVIYWKFPAEGTSEEEWPYQYYICGAKGDIKIRQADHQIRLTVYGWNAYAEKTLTIGKPPAGGVHKEIWMYEAS